MTRISYHREKKPTAETSYVGNSKADAKGKHINPRNSMPNSTKSFRFSVTDQKYSFNINKNQNNHVAKAKRPYLQNNINFNPLETAYNPEDEENCCITGGNCTDCEENWDEHSPFVDTCPEGQYMNVTECSQCSSNCTTCEDNENKCTSCSDDKKLLNNMCVDHCPDEYFDNNSVCNMCDSSCATCVETATKCTKCANSNHFLQDGVCKESCDSSYYPDTNKFCHLCNESCLTCSGPNTCLSCISQNFLQGDKCVTQCNTGYFSNNDNKQCEKCMDNCINCNSYTCLECEENYKSDGNRGCVKIDETVDVEKANYVRSFQQLSLELLFSFGATDNLII